MPHLANPKLLTGTARDKKVVLILGDGVHIILAGRRQLAGCFGHTAGDDERSSVAAQQECSVAREPVPEEALAAKWNVDLGWTGLRPRRQGRIALRLPCSARRPIRDQVIRTVSYQRPRRGRVEIPEAVKADRRTRPCRGGAARYFGAPAEVRHPPAPISWRGDRLRSPVRWNPRRTYR